MVSNKFILLFLEKINYSKGQTERVPDGVDKSWTIIEEKSRSCRSGICKKLCKANKWRSTVTANVAGPRDPVTVTDGVTSQCWTDGAEHRAAESLRNAQTELQQSLTNPLQTNVNDSEARRRRQSFFLDNVLISEKELATINFVNVF